MHRTRRPTAWRILLGLLVLGTATGCSDRVGDLRDEIRGRNVVMILMDAAAYGHYGFAGYERATTPVIDGLAAEGVVFDHAYAPAASTSHSVFSLLTSTFSFLAERQGLKGIVDAPFRVTEDTRLMPELLAAHFPHRTGISGNPWFGPDFGFDRGFTDFHEVYDATAVPDSTKKYGERTVDLFEQDLARWGEGPAFAYIHFLEPHEPYTPPDEFARRFDPVAADSVVATAQALLPYRLDPPSKQRQEWIRALYDANLAYVDAQVGRIVQALKEAGEWEDTVLLLIADHGEAFWQHGVWGHGRHTYDEFVRIPFVLRIPGREDLAGRRIHENVSLVDILPTLLDAHDEEVPPEHVGRSLLPLLAGEAGDFAEREIYFRNTHSDAPEFSLRKGRHKWIYKVYQGRYELYDLEADPAETRDLARLGQVSPALAELRKKIALWVASGTGRVEPVEEMDPQTEARLRSIGYF